jgi:hypothetical protein
MDGWTRMACSLAHHKNFRPGLQQLALCFTCVTP